MALVWISFYGTLSNEDWLLFIFLEIEVCENGSCKNGGLCINLPFGGFICKCSNGYTGERCENAP